MKAALKWLRERSLIHQIRTLIERNEAMLQNLDVLTSSMNAIAQHLSDLVAAQQEATSTGVQAGVNAALAGVQTQIDTLVSSAQAIDKTLTDAIAAAKA